ncbi:uncharacterized protein LOC111330519 [Stylophora pistillata]|uniref:uncharacterized protein LOC111330519 n=1 Tax=Stylophora pistillata TaxID=50429 RepID=UPI000C04A1DB|nr:uncharacterized protein LOC111330519 [Stylophora pistillata]
MLWISARNQSISQISWHNSTCELRSKLRWEIPAAAYMKAEITLAGEVNLSFTAQSGRASSTAFFFTRKVDRALGKLRYTIRWNSNRTFILTEQSGKVLLENSSSVKNSHVFYVASASKNYITFQSKTAGKFLMADAQGVIGLTSNSHVATYFKMRC